jgi:parallel beta-helix repeat protein
MRALIAILVGAGLCAGAYFAAVTPGILDSGSPVIIAKAGVDLAAELDKLPDNARPTICIPMGDDLQKRVSELLAVLPQGSTIQFEEGKYEFTNSLQVRAENVTIKGKGQDKTILNFEKQLAGTGGEGILAKADGFTMEDITVEETKGDAIKVEGSNGVVFRHVSTLWHNEGNPKNGAYGLYPVNCKNVLIEHCRAEGASDAGIYVGQSQNIVVRYSHAEKNVAGIEIENSKNADVYENTATNNAGGLLIFDLPALPAGNGGGHRVYKNKLYKNNHDNFAPAGNIVASIPPGTGLMVMATDNVEVFENTLDSNKSSNVSIISFNYTGRKIEDEKYDPVPEGIYIHNNTFVGGGDDPAGTVKMLALLVGTPIPDILYDGIPNPKSLVDGKVPPEKRVYIENNKDADFANLRLDLVESLASLLDPAKAAEHAKRIERDLTVVAGQLSSRKDPVVLEGVQMTTH